MIHSKTDMDVLIQMEMDGPTLMEFGLLLMALMHFLVTLLDGQMLMAME